MFLLPFRTEPLARGADAADGLPGRVEFRPHRAGHEADGGRLRIRRQPLHDNREYSRLFGNSPRRDIDDLLQRSDVGFSTTSSAVNY